MPTTQSAAQAFGQGFKQAAVANGVIMGAFLVSDVLTHNLTETCRQTSRGPSNRPTTLKQAFGDITYNMIEGTVLGIAVQASARVLGRPAQSHKVARVIGFGALFGAYDVIKTRVWKLPARTPAVVELISNAR